MLPSTPAINVFSPAGWIAFLAVLIGLVVRLLKADKLNDFLARFGIGAVPKKALPWVALTIGALSATIEAKVGGMDWRAAVNMTIAGLLSGTIAIGGNETLPTLARGISPFLADLFFGKNAGPGLPTSDQAKPAVVKAPPGTNILGVLCLSLAILLGAGGCAAVMSFLPTVIAAVSDATMILDQIQTFVTNYYRDHPDATKEKQAMLALAKARSALIGAQRAAQGAEKLDQKKIDEAFQDFKVAYQEVLAIVGPLGVTSGDGLHATEHGLTVPTPEALNLKVPAR